LEAWLLLGGLLLENTACDASAYELLLGLAGLVTELRDHLLLAVCLWLLLLVVQSVPLEELACIRVGSSEERVGAT
jgi:hypothetical protein